MSRQWSYSRFRDRFIVLTASFSETLSAREGWVQNILYSVHQVLLLLLIISCNSNRDCLMTFWMSMPNIATKPCYLDGPDWRLWSFQWRYIFNMMTVIILLKRTTCYHRNKVMDLKCTAQILWHLVQYCTLISVVSTVLFGLKRSNCHLMQCSNDVPMRHIQWILIPD